MAMQADKLLDVAVLAARTAGAHAFSNRHRRYEIDESSPHDVKLRLDRECQDVAESVIREAFPEHVLFGEEAGSYDAEAEYLWIIDPIDGTVNFLHDATHWGPSVACRFGGQIVAGAVYLPALDECYSASLEQKALCNGEPLSASKTPTLEQSLVITGLSRHAHNDQAFEVFRRLANRSQKIRILGAAAADMCMVAAGRADGYYETSLYMWDWAAAGLIARQAGAHVEVLEQYDELRARVMCSNPQIANELKSAILENGS